MKDWLHEFLAWAKDVADHDRWTILCALLVGLSLVVSGCLFGPIEVKSPATGELIPEAELPAAIAELQAEVTAKYEEADRFAAVAQSRTEVAVAVANDERQRREAFWATIGQTVQAVVPPGYELYLAPILGVLNLAQLFDRRRKDAVIAEIKTPKGANGATG